MSKLFDTLEKISQNEVVPDIEYSAGREVGLQKNQWPLYLFGIIIFGSFLFWGIYFFYFHKNKTIATNFYEQNLLERYEAQGQDQVIELELPSEKDKLSGNFSSPNDNRHELEHMIALNNQGVALVTRNQHWQGIYCFEKARKLQPGRIEPLINLSVALTELHLYGPARRYFDEAVKLDPNNPFLCKNIDIATGLGLLKE